VFARFLVVAACGLLFCGMGVQRRTGIPPAMYGEALYVLSDAHTEGWGTGNRLEKTMMVSRFIADPLAYWFVLCGDVSVAPNDGSEPESCMVNCFLTPIRGANKTVFGAPANHDTDAGFDPNAPYGSGLDERYYEDITDLDQPIFERFAQRFPNVNGHGYGVVTIKALRFLFLNLNVDTLNAYPNTCPPGYTSQENPDYPGVYDSTSAQRVWLTGALESFKGDWLMSFGGRSWYSPRHVLPSRPNILDRYRGSMLDQLDRHGNRIHFTADPHAAGVTRPLRVGLVAANDSPFFAHHVEPVGGGTTAMRPAFFDDPDSTKWQWFFPPSGPSTTYRNWTVFSKAQFFGLSCVIGMYRAKVNEDSLMYKFVVRHSSSDAVSYLDDEDGDKIPPIEGWSP
jgi:hypothetical protein